MRFEYKFRWDVGTSRHSTDTTEVDAIDCDDFINNVIPQIAAKLGLTSYGVEWREIRG